VSQARQASWTAGGLVLIGLAAMLWGTSGSVMVILADRAAASALLVGLARLWIAALLLLGTALVAGVSLVVAPPDRWRCLAMGACMAGYQAAYFPAVTLGGIVIVALVAICSAPLVIAALAPWLLGERRSRPVHVALGLGVLGTALLVAAPGAAPPPRFVGGALLALVAGLAYALYVLAAKASLARSAPLSLAALTFTVAAVLLTPALFWIPTPGPQLAVGWPWLLYLGGIATAGAYAMYTVGLRHVPASVAGVTTLLEPLTAAILGVALFGERLGAGGWLGALLLFIALGLLLVSRR
jgi:DME family drug/metabolite transporter